MSHHDEHDVLGARRSRRALSFALTLGCLAGCKKGDSDPAPEVRECEPADVRAAREARDVARLRTLPELFGRGRAELGPRLRAIAVPGAPRSADVARRIEALTQETGIGVRLVDDRTGVATIEVAVGWFDDSWGGTCDPSPDNPCSCYYARDDRGLCEDLLRRLEAAWGPPETDGFTAIWVDEARARRAVMRRCVLSFEPVTDAPPGP